MMPHLLAISIGPVQEFIAAARRTRDLWYGSTLLSEISKAAARAVRDQGSQLIFPAPERPVDLDPGSPLQVANVVLAGVPDGDPKDVADRARDAAKSHWRAEAEAARARYRGAIDEVIWTDQVEDVIEFFAAWVPLGDGRDDYRKARRRVMRLLTGRKAGRDFPPARGKHRVPKSSLDGLRDSVLKPPDQWAPGERRPLRLKKGEQLDIVGLVKRTAGGKAPYPSVARVAADPWIRGLVRARGPDVFAPLSHACDTLGPAKIHRLPTADEGFPQYAVFPFEGTVVYPSRHPDLKEESELSDEELEALAGSLADLTGKFEEPSPYLAVLVADGDRVGEALSRAECDEEHRDFSRRLSCFASRARGIMERNQGVLVYAGGDDVLGFVPVDLCLKCARELHDAFGESMGHGGEGNDGTPTLSVGLAIAHFMENLEDLLDYGRDAEKHAKEPRGGERDQKERDGLAIHLHKRGGVPTRVRSNWDDKPDERLLHLADLLNARAMPGRVAYDLHRVADVYENWDAIAEVSDAIRRDARRIIEAKQPRGGGLDAVRAELPLERVTDARSLRRLADEILVARQIAAAKRQAEGRKPAEEVPA